MRSYATLKCVYDLGHSGEGKIKDAKWPRDDGLLKRKKKIWNNKNIVFLKVFLLFKLQYASSAQSEQLEILMSFSWIYLSLTACLLPTYLLTSKKSVFAQIRFKFCASQEVYTYTYLPPYVVVPLYHCINL